MIAIVVSEHEKVSERIKNVLAEYKIVKCHNFLEAVKEVSKQVECKLVLAEYEMKPYNGVEILKCVKEMKRFLSTILIIDKGNEDAEIEALRNEIDLVVENDKSEVVIRAYIDKLLAEASKKTDDNELIIKGVAVAFTRKEKEIANILMRDKGKIITREEIAEKVWNSNQNIRKIDIHIKSIRKKLIKEGIPDCIDTIRGFGYRWKDSV